MHGLFSKGILMLFRFLLTVTLMFALSMPALAHDGRRFEVQVIDNQLVAQGYISGSGALDDGGGLIRPYVNAIHGHFSNSELQPNYATSTLPGYNVLDDAAALTGFDLTMTITGFQKWSSPAMSGPVNLTGLDNDETMAVNFGGVAVLSTTYGTTGPDSFTLVSNFNGTDAGDLDLLFEFVGDHPSGEIYVIESVLSTNAPGIADSGTVYTLLSPDGIGMAERLHHQSLYLESQLGAAVPEPSTLAIAGLLPALMRRRRG